MSPVTRRWQRDLDQQEAANRPTEVTIVDGKTVPVDDSDRNDILWMQLRKSVAMTARRKETA